MACASGQVLAISTHALTEGDLWESALRSQTQQISTHALTEGDPVGSAACAIVCGFQLTPSRRATANLDKFFF